MDNNNSLSSTVSQGHTAFKAEDYEQAAGFFATAAAEYQQTGDTLNAAEMANNRSVALLKAGSPQAAFDAAAGTAEIFAQAGDVKRQAMAMANQASALEGLKKDKDALGLYEQSNELLKQVGDKELRSYVLKCISAIQLRSGSQFEAMASMQAAIDNKPSQTVKDRFLNRLIKQVFTLLRR